MGKSARKWIKTFFGKKSARSASGKEKRKAVLKLEGDKDGPDNRQTEEPLVATAPVIHQQPKVDWKDDQISKMEGGTATVDLASNIADSQRSVECDRTDILEKDKAAAKVQATFRGYLARRAFRALRGIIRLQALVRGHLVRRQAVATLRSLQGIVKLQGLIRGHIIRQSNTEQKAVTNKISVKDTKPNGLFSRNDKFPVNSFTRNLLSSSPSALPLKLQYNQSDPNSVFNWLERWTLMRSWEPAPQPKEVLPGSKSRAKQYTVSLVQTVASSRSKRITKRGANVDSPGSPHASSDDGKLKRAMRKPQSSSAVDSTPEHPKSEFEKVKQNLRKISSLTPNSVPDKDKPEKEPETSKDSSRRVSISPSTPISVTDKDKTVKELETSKESSRRVSISPSTPNSVTDKYKPVKEPETLKDSSRRASLSPDVPDLAAGESTDMVTSDIKLDPVNSRDVDTLVMDSPKVDQPVSLLHDNNPLNENFPSEIIEKETDVCSVTDNGTAKEIRTNHEAEKTKKRRSSFPAKADENGSPSTPTLPSYMAATESAKAKLRGQGSPRFSSENAEKNGNTRRYSLPASSNGKVSSPSLRAQRLIQASGKGSIRNDKSLLSSRDDNDKLVTEWKR